jgi:methionyl-tRNA formyltransferase
LSYVYIGTDAFAAAVLRLLAAAGNPPDLVISRPDAPKGRGRRMTAPPVAESALDLGLELLQPESIGDESVDATIDSKDPSALALCAYGAIIREPLLSKRPILNLHPSILPRWRGATPIERAIMEGDSQSGVSIIQLVEELDAGPVAAQRAIDVMPDDTFESLSSRLVVLGAEMLAQSLADAERGQLVFEPQSPEGATYAERLESADRFLDVEGTAARAERKVRALSPHIGARLAMPDTEPIGVRAVSSSDAKVAPGEVHVMAGELLVGFADGTLRIDRLVPPGGREMESADWLRGRSA